MKPVRFKGHNVVFGVDQPEYQPLPAHRDEKGTVITQWELTEEERKAIATGSNLCLALETFNKPLQPLVPYIDESELKSEKVLLSESVKMVKEFHDLFEHPIGRVIGEEPLHIRQLRVKLLFEEIMELAEASDVRQTAAVLCFKHLQKENVKVQVKGSDVALDMTDIPVDGYNVDVVEEADALADLQYVLDGKKLTSGLYIHMEEVFKIVHQNNMTKAHSSETHANETIERKPEEGPFTKAERGGLWFIYNKDGKLTKPWDHKKVSIKSIIFGK